MKLIKINTDHYIIVDDSEIKEGDWVYQPMTNAVYKTSRTDNSDIGYKITHSTQSLEFGWAQEGRDIVSKKVYDKVQSLSLSEVKELIDEVDVESIAEDKTNIRILRHKTPSQVARQYFDGYVDGYNQALEDNKDKKYTEEDLRKAISETRRGMLFLDKYVNEFIQSLQPKTKWEVEYDENGKLKLV